MHVLYSVPEVTHTLCIVMFYLNPGSAKPKPKPLLQRFAEMVQ